ncbi:SPOSA6832_00513 [Sporobolomyces salmonicolor]|uniref:enoyl-[acyl-carrier-protein] reductase n=1 Tax=Sporidiobolus salmonicolor TaxID=5005 RepID=A0A0D6EGI6_SPOSA|nr:SPOSA6832_00513 [Sporobolomyces salmonicolor]
MLRSSFASKRLFTSSSRLLAGTTSSIEARAVVFTEHGDPTKVLKAHRYKLPKLAKGENVIQGVYPSKPKVRDDLGPEPVSIMGNEGVATVEGFVEDGEVEKTLKVGDKGTWASHANLPFTSLIPLPASLHLTHRQSATLAINPPTAYRMLSDFVPLNPEDPNRKKGKKQWVIQNGANSAVGQAVIQIAKEWGVGTINLVRDRPSIEALKEQLTALGADRVLTYDEFLDRSNDIRSQIKQWVGKDGELLLALNCVGGKETAEMAKLLGVGGKLVTYGGMAKTALALPPSLFIFKKLTATGFWLTNWVATHPRERTPMMHALAGLIADGKLKEPETEVVVLEGSDDDVRQRLSDVMKRLEEGRAGKKVLLHWQEESEPSGADRQADDV